MFIINFFLGRVACAAFIMPDRMEFQVLLISVILSRTRDVGSVPLFKAKALELVCVANVSHWTGSTVLYKKTVREMLDCFRAALVGLSKIPSLSNWTKS